MRHLTVPPFLRPAMLDHLSPGKTARFIQGWFTWLESDPLFSSPPSLKIVSSWFNLPHWSGGCMFTFVTPSLGPHIKFYGIHNTEHRLSHAKRLIVSCDRIKYTCVHRQRSYITHHSGRLAWISCQFRHGTVSTSKRLHSESRAAIEIMFIIWTTFVRLLSSWVCLCSWIMQNHAYQWTAG